MTSDHDQALALLPLFSSFTLAEIDSLRTRLAAEPDRNLAPGGEQKGWLAWLFKNNDV